MTASQRRTASGALLISFCMALGACAAPVVSRAPSAPETALTSADVCYEIFVRSFYDSDGDGVGDLNGLTQKLDYINDGNPDSERDLGASCIWLMPVAESPSYHGYDVSNYYRVEPDYGTNEDFKRMVAEAHRRGIRVLVDMVPNHSSSEHPFFQQALHDPESPYRDWYLWLPSHPGFKTHWGGDSWHRSPVRDEYYYGFFWHEMPDLNVENPEVVAELKRVATFWLREMGVDGFRMDAVRHLVEGDSGRVSEHHPGSHVFLRDYAAHVRSVKPDAYTVGEVWGSMDELLAYYPDQLTSYFVFELSDSLLSAVQTGSAAKVFPGYLRMQDTLPGHRWATLLRNHDQTRTLTVLNGDVARARMAATLLLTLPGLPFIYYGEEIGMTGDKPDERIRTPMQWSSRPGLGFTSGTPWQEPQSDWQRTSVEIQDADPGSLLNLHRRLIHLRARNPALGTGELIPLTASSGQVAAYLRRDGEHVVLVIANLGTTPVAGVTLASSAPVLGAGEYVARDLLDGPDAAGLQVTPSGQIQGYAPLPSIGPMESRILQLVRGRR